MLAKRLGIYQIAYMLTHYDMGDEFHGLVFTGGPLYSDLEKACGTSCDVGASPDYPDTSAGCFAAVSRWGVDQGFGQAADPNIREGDTAGGCGHLQGQLGLMEECGEDRFPYLCMSHSHEDPTDPNRQVIEDLFESNSIAVELTRWTYDYHADLGLWFLYGDGDGGSAVIQQEIFSDAVDHNVGWVGPLPVLNTDHRVPETPEGRAAIRDALLDSCVEPLS